MRVLIVEDQKQMAEIVHKMLEQMKYFDKIDEAGNGEIAWLKLEENKETDPYHLIVCDVAMPELDGIGLLKRCRSHADFAHVPFIMISASSQEAFIASALGEWGASDFIVKPFSFVMLEKRVKTLLKRLQSPEESLFRQAAKLNKKGAANEALEVIGQWEAENQLNMAKWFNLKGECLIEAGQDEAAVKELEKAMAISNIYLAAYKNYAHAQQNLGNLDKAIETLEYMEEISPIDEERTLSLGKALLQAGRKDDSKKCMDGLLRRSPRQERENILKKVAGIYLDAGLFKEAAETYQEALQDDPGNIDASNRLGIALRQQGKYDEAERCYMAALQHNPDHPAIYHNLGVLYCVKKNYTGAEKFFRRALDRDPNFEASKSMLQTIEKLKKENP